MKPGHFSFGSGKMETCLKQIGSQQRRDKNLHKYALPRNDFKNKGIILTKLAV